MSNSIPALWRLSILLAALALGCSGSGAPPALLVSGKVIVNKMPASGVYVLFYPAADAVKKVAAAATQTDSAGSFSAKVPEAGNYVVTVFWPTISVVQGESIEGEDRFRGRYRNPQQPVLSVPIDKERQELAPITLASP